MLDRAVMGDVPKKHHIAARTAEGALLYEECLTREGFDGPYTIMYHRYKPHVQECVPVCTESFVVPVAAPAAGLKKRHFKAQDMVCGPSSFLSGRVPFLFNDDVVVGVVKPSLPCRAYFSNGDGDDLYFVLHGQGVLRSVMGDVAYGPGDYVCVPKGVIHRFIPQDGVQHVVLSMECKGGVGLLKQWRNAVGQLRMDAPYCHRDFRKPVFRGMVDEGIREVVVKRGDVFYAFASAHTPLDVVGWDGSVYPWCFSVYDFQPRVGLVHLPPTWHGTFAMRGALVCSFVPRLVDFHPEAVPCPYPHSSVDCDEVIFYCKGHFTSRKGVSEGSVSYHPMGIPHGPHPGAYEASIGTQRTDELAVMLDTFLPLKPTPAAVAVEDSAYHNSFIG
jgi:homogentisate 1,2-dioxygenase